MRITLMSMTPFPPPGFTPLAEQDKRKTGRALLSRSSASRGVVLFMVLVLSVILYLIVSTLLFLAMSEIHLADFEQRSTQAFYLAESGSSLGLARLRTTYAYRTDTSDTFPVGGNPGMCSVEFYDGTKDGNGHYRKALSPALYHLVLRGIGSVPGAHTAARRLVEQHVRLKPFTLFAQHALAVRGGCAITGNLHGNASVSIESASSVTGDVTAWGNVFNSGTISGSTSEEEPEIALPECAFDQYLPQYWYHGVEYSAKPLTHDTLTLSPSGGVDPPVPTVELYSGFPTPDNPAGVFYPPSAFTGTVRALYVRGTVVIPATYPGAVNINGILNIQPVDTFPAILSVHSLTANLIGNLDVFSSSLPKNEIRGVIYTLGDMTLTGSNTTGQIVKGSLWGQNVTVTGNPALQVSYDSSAFADPPPGMDFIELGAWQEILE